MMKSNLTTTLFPLIMMFLVTTWLPSQKLFSQNTDSLIHPYYFQLQLNDLKSTNPVYSIVEGKFGEYFFATDNGVIRFDGQSAHFLENPTSHTNAGSSLQKDQYNNIYFENFDGYVFHIKRDSLLLINKNKSVFYLPYGIWKDQLTIIQQNGVDLYDTRNQQFIKTIPFKLGIPKSSVQLDDKFYIISDKELMAIGEDSIQTSSLEKWNIGNKTKLVFTDSSFIYICNRDNVDQNILVFDKNLKYLNTIHLKNRNFIQNIKFLNNQMWILSNKGIDVYNRKNLNFKYVYSLFKEVSVTDIMYDRKGVTWVTTIGNGVIIVPNINHQYLVNINYKVNAINKKKDHYYFGTTEGKIFKTNKDFQDYLFYYNNNRSISDILLDNDINGVFVIDNSGFSIVSDKNIQSYDLALKSIVSIDEKYFAIATSSIIGLMKKNNKKGISSKWDEIFNSNENDGNISVLYSGVRSKSITYDSIAEIIYVATNTGLYKFDINKNLQELKDQDSSIIAKNVEFHEGKLYYNTYTGQLKVLQNNSVSSMDFQKQFVKSFKKEGTDLIIMLNDHFLKYNINTKKLQYLPIRIANLEITDYFLENGFVILLTNEGIIKAIVEDTQIKNLPDFFLQKLKINDSVLSEDFNQILSYDQNNISINYYINDIGTYVPYQLFYQINQDGWKLLDISQQYLSFLKIQPGKYRVQFKMNDEILEESVNFTIKSPFWKTYWFYLVLFITAISTIYFYYHWRIRVFGKQIQLMHEKVELERQLGQSILTSVKAQMNPHFFFNALNTIQAYILKNDKAQAINYLSKFSILTRRILNYSEKEDILLVEEMDSLKLYMELELVRANNRFNFNIQSDNIGDKIFSIVIPSMLIQPYVENAIKHGILTSDKHCTIQIRFEISGKNLIVVVEDDGIGRKAAVELKRKSTHDSFSMKANLKRLDVLNKLNKTPISCEIIDKIDDQNKSLGTIVKIYIPLKIKEKEENV